MEKQFLFLYDDTPPYLYTAEEKRLRHAALQVIDTLIISGINQHTARLAVCSILNQIRIAYASR
jgi:hypothetical protein